MNDALGNPISLGDLYVMAASAVHDSGTRVTLDTGRSLVTVAGTSLTPLSELLAEIGDDADYVLRDGSTPLTGNWAVGGYDISGVGALGVGAIAASSDSIIDAELEVSLNLVVGGSTTTDTLDAGATTLDSLVIGGALPAGDLFAVVTGGGTLTLRSSDGYLEVPAGLGVTDGATIGTGDLTLTEGNITLAATATVDGVDVSAHAADSTIHFTAASLNLGDYLKKNGTVALTGNWATGGYNITGIGALDAGSTTLDTLAVGGSLTAGDILTIDTGGTDIHVDATTGYIGVGGNASASAVLNLISSNASHTPLLATLSTNALNNVAQIRNFDTGSSAGARIWLGTSGGGSAIYLMSVPDAVSGTHYSCLGLDKGTQETRLSLSTTVNYPFMRTLDTGETVFGLPTCIAPAAGQTFAIDCTGGKTYWTDATGDVNFPSDVTLVGDISCENASIGTDLGVAGSIDNSGGDIATDALDVAGDATVGDQLAVGNTSVTAGRLAEFVATGGTSYLEDSSGDWTLGANLTVADDVSCDGLDVNTTREYVFDYTNEGYSNMTNTTHIYCDSSVEALNQTLPLATVGLGRVYVITDSGSYGTTVGTSGSDTIVGSASMNGAWATYMSDGISKWYRIQWG